MHRIHLNQFILNSFYIGQVQQNILVFVPSTTFTGRSRQLILGPPNLHCEQQSLE
jgi:hypothetical protein